MSIVRGNDELAFFLRQFKGDRLLAEICSDLKYRSCPLKCHFQAHDVRKGDLSHHIKHHILFRPILEHLLRPDEYWEERFGYHHEESRRRNLSIGILQQLVIYETRNKSNHHARYIAIYKLNSDFDISIAVLSYMLNRSIGFIGNLATSGMIIEKQQNIPRWLKNILSSSGVTTGTTSSSSRCCAPSSARKSSQDL